MLHPVEPGPGGVAILRGEGELTGVDPEQLRALFREHGAIWLRGFRTTPFDYLTLISAHVRELITLNSRERRRHFAVPEIRSVTGGNEALNFHTEMGHVPLRPELLSFWCEKAPVEGGQTMLLDGAALWAALSPSTRALFEERRVLYVMRAPHEWWTDRVGGDTREHVDRLLGAVPDVTYDIEAGGTLVIEWRTHAVFRPRFGDALVFASNLFPYVVPGLTVGFEDGTPIPRAIQEELHTTGERLAAQIDWVAGEVVIFDNTRWLHGRRAVRGLGRRVHMLQGYLAF